MGILEQIIQMKQQGFSDQDIYQNLQSQGADPRSIQDAFNQAQIKNIISEDEMQPSITDSSQDAPQQETYDPSYTTPTYEPQQQTTMAPEQYGSQSSDNFVEIAEQVFQEKNSKTEKKLNELTEFKILAETQVKTMEERMKRIESTIDTLQSAILEKIGSYGTNLDTIKKEISMVQDSFTKMIDHKTRK